MGSDMTLSKSRLQEICIPDIGRRLLRLQLPGLYTPLVLKCINGCDTSCPVASLFCSYNHCLGRSVYVLFDSTVINCHRLISIVAHNSRYTGHGSSNSGKEVMCQ